MSFDDVILPVHATGESLGGAVADCAGEARVEAGRGDWTLISDSRTASTPSASGIPNIVIDCPPTLGLLTVNALVAATHLLIPIQSSYFALEGTDDLLETDREGASRANPSLRSSAS